MALRICWLEEGWRTSVNFTHYYSPFPGKKEKRNIMDTKKITEEICKEMATKAVALMQKHGLPETQENANILHEAMADGMDILIPKVEAKIKLIILAYETEIADILSHDC